MNIIKLFDSPTPSPETLPRAGTGLSSAAATPGAVSSSWNKAQAIAGVVIMEIYRRKDFYVLFFLTALVTLVMGSVTFFN